MMSEKERYFFMGQLLHAARAIQFVALIIVYLSNYLEGIIYGDLPTLVFVTFGVGVIGDTVFVVMKHKWRMFLVAGVFFTVLGVMLGLAQWGYYLISYGFGESVQGLVILLLSLIDIALWLLYRIRGLETKVVEESIELV